MILRRVLIVLLLSVALLLVSCLFLSPVFWRRGSTKETSNPPVGASSPWGVYLPSLGQLPPGVGFTPFIVVVPVILYAGRACSNGLCPLVFSGSRCSLFGQFSLQGVQSSSVLSLPKFSIFLFCVPCSRVYFRPV